MADLLIRPGKGQSRTWLKHYIELVHQGGVLAISTKSHIQAIEVVAKKPRKQVSWTRIQK